MERLVKFTGTMILAPEVIIGCKPPLTPRPASKYEISLAGKYYPDGVLNNNMTVEGLCNVWMNGEKLNPTQFSGLPVDGETDSIATWRFSMGSQVKITDLDTGLSKIVTVTDRGPNEIKYPGHVCDMTPKVAREIAHGASYDVKIRLEPATGTVFDFINSGNQPKNSSTDKVQTQQTVPGKDYCVSKINSSIVRKVNESPHPGDKSKCVSGADGNPVWEAIK